MTTEFEMYMDNLKQFGIPEVERNPTAWKIAEMLEPAWFVPTYTVTGSGGSYQELGLDNYPGQHLRFQKRAYERALSIIEMVKKDGCSCQGCNCKL